jgi:hypothetical protein
MADDPLINAALQRGRRLVASKKQAEANLAIAVANGYEDDIGDAIAEIASIDRQGAELNQLYNQHVAASQPRQPMPQTEGEFMAKSPERMDYSDVQRVASKSKYGAVTDDEMRRGIAELQRRKAGGSYKD